MDKRARIEELERRVQDLEERLKRIKQSRYWSLFPQCLVLALLPYQSPDTSCQPLTIKGMTSTGVADGHKEALDACRMVYKVM